MNVLKRIARHTRLTLTNYAPKPSPPFLVLFINSICNMKCEHCFYWTSLNKRDDLTKDEIFALSRSLGRIENLNLSGGEPFLRKEFSEICRQFIRQNGRSMCRPTDGIGTRPSRRSRKLSRSRRSICSSPSCRSTAWRRFTTRSGWRRDRSSAPWRRTTRSPSCSGRTRGCGSTRSRRRPTSTSRRSTS
ncbi:MAG: radical SAM protein [Vicinamibacteria bacterium]|nr:radical SAM protein [Vicinamibacteria bacterium]